MLEAAQKINFEQIDSLQSEFRELASIEDTIKSNNNAFQKLVNKVTGRSAFFTKAEKVDKLIEEVDSIIELIASRGSTRGKAMSQKTMDRYLAKAEKSAKAQRTLDAIDRANTRRAQQRIGLYVDEAAKEAGILKADIELYRKRAKLAGFTDKQISKNLVRITQDGAGPVAAYAKKIKSLETAVLRREAQQRELDEYSKVALPSEKWQWITISTKPCPDCQIRAGVILSIGEWEAKGTPGSGQTVCSSYCMCKLMPVSIAEDMFPDVKTFKWDRSSGVLTTAGDMRTFGSKKARG